MIRLALAVMIGVAAFGACIGNGDPPARPLTETPCVLPQTDAGATDEWSLWSGPVKLRGANTWQKRPTPDIDSVFPLYTHEDLRKLACWGANYVNLSIPGPMTEGPDEYTWDERVWANLDSMVTRADSAGLFVVVSFRTGPGRSEYVFDDEEEPVIIDLWTTAAAQDAWVAMWGRTAELLRNRRAVIGYDLMVEPLLDSERGSTRLQTWDTLAARMVDTIRKVDPVTPILVGAAPGGYVSSLQNLDTTLLKPKARRIVFTVHQYNPWSYTNQPPDTPRAFSDSVRQELDTIYNQLRRWRDSVRVPLAVNEFGVFRWAVSADSFISEQIRLIERVPANHALWVWDPPHDYIGWDEFNFRHGPEPENHKDEPRSKLADAIRTAWRSNTVRLPRGP